MRMTFSVIIAAVLMLAGCSEKEFVTTDEVYQIMTMEIEQLRQEIDRVASGSNEAVAEMQITVSINDQLIKNLPDIAEKQGFIHDINVPGLLATVDFAEKVTDENAPNGFRIENKRVENEKVQIPGAVQVYALDGVKLIFSSLAELEEINPNRFFSFYYAGGKLVLIVEQYLP